MTRYQELEKKAADCLLCAARCHKNGKIDMKALWLKRCRDLREKMLGLTIEESEAKV